CRRAGLEGALSQEVAGETDFQGHEAHGWGASAEGAQPRVAAGPSPVGRRLVLVPPTMAVLAWGVGLAVRSLRMQDGEFVGRQTMESELKAYLWPVDGTPAHAPPTRWRRFLDRHLPSLVIYLMVATLVGVVLYPHMVVTVPSGYVGVLWKRFGGGTVLDPRRLKNEGFNLILPWNRVFLYDLRLQSFTESYNAISSDGVSLTATVIVRFRLQRDSVPVVHQAVGPDYVKVLAMPGIGSLTREVIAQYTAEQVYSTARQEIQDKIRSLVEARLSEKM